LKGFLGVRPSLYTGPCRPMETEVDEVGNPPERSDLYSRDVCRTVTPVL
jgi:hypothetical protein